MATDVDRLVGMIGSGRSLILIPTHEEGHALDCVRRAALEVSADLLVWDAVTGLIEGLISGEKPATGTENAAAAMYHAAEHSPDAMVCLLDVFDHLGDPATMRALRNLERAAREHGGCVVLIDHRDSAPAVVRAHASVLELSLPDEEELRGIVRRTARRLHEERPIVLDLSERDLGAIIRNLRGLNRRQAERVIVDVILDDRKLTPTIWIR